MNTYPYTLGYEKNTLLDNYFDSYVSQLQEMGKGVLPTELLGTGDFLLIPDVSTTIEGYIQRKFSMEEAVSFLFSEWGKYSSGQKNEMFAYMGERIEHTNIRLTPHDANPDNSKEAHPDHKKDGVGIGWGGVTQGDWFELYARSFFLLRSVSPGFSYELDRMIKKVVPIGVSVSKHNSASYSSCIGHLYMSYPIELEGPEFAVLEAIIHESNHNKLNLIMKSDPLVINTREEIYYSPYRPDARHIHGIYLGLHALSAVIWVFARGLLDKTLDLSPRWQEKVLTYHMKNALSIRVLEKYGKFTKLGGEIFEEMKTIQTESNGFLCGLMGGDRKWAALEGVKLHFSEVQSNYPYLRY